MRENEQILIGDRPTCTNGLDVFYIWSACTNLHR